MAMTIYGLFVLPVLAWIGVAVTIRTMRPPKATTVQIVSFLTFSVACLAAGTALAIAFKSSPLLLLAGFVEGVAIYGLVFLQFWKLKISEGQKKESPST